ncbi:MAG: patatin-like phospholipase family protein [Bacilli bacterium]|nr:patatin-like phospholipase family protein [Bacilli bacterium]
MSKNVNKRALVLSGGGSRGAYQIGAYKALTELGLKFDIITGTSIGAINGALITQSDEEKIYKFWEEVDYQSVFDSSFFTKEENLSKKKVFKEYLKEVIIKKGLSIKNLENQINKYVDYNKISNSNIKFGIVIYDFDKKKPEFITSKEWNKKNFGDYIIASATFYPFFKKKKIKDIYYVDGGYYDNLPINLAEQMGATEVIAIDIGLFGKRKKVENTKLAIKYIKPTSKLGLSFIFDKEVSEKNYILGYNDTMKIFNKYEGNKYTFYLDEISKYYEENKNKIAEIYNKYFIKIGTKNFDYSDFINSIDFIADKLNIDCSKVYNIKQFNELVLENTKTLNIDYKHKTLFRIKVKLFGRRKSVIRRLILKISNNKIKSIDRYDKKVILSAIYIYSIIDSH